MGYGIRSHDGTIGRLGRRIVDVLSGLGLDGRSDSEDDFAIDESLSIPEKLDRYLQSEQILHHLYVIREFADYARQLGFEGTVEHLLPVIKRVQADPQPVLRQALVEQMAELSDYMWSLDNPDARSVFVMQLFPVVAELVVDPNSQVRLSSTEAMILITKPHTVQPFLGQILHVLQHLTEEKLEDEFRIEAMRIIHHLSPLV